MTARPATVPHPPEMSFNAVVTMNSRLRPHTGQVDRGPARGTRWRGIRASVLASLYLATVRGAAPDPEC